MADATDIVPDDDATRTTATDGREIGDRAKATRRRLLDAARFLLDRDGLSDMRLVDITRRIEASPATFYQYFSDIDDVLLELADEVTSDALALIERLDAPWAEVTDYPQATDFVHAYLAYWDTNGAVLRVRNLKAEEGESEFRRVRSEAQVPLILALATKVEASIEAGRVAREIDPTATAAAVLAMLERLTAYRGELRQRGAEPDALETTLARIAFQLISGCTVK